MVHGGRADERRAGRSEHERDEVQLPALRPQLTCDQDDKGAGRDTRRGREQLARALEVPPTEPFRCPTQPAREGEPQRWRMPRAGLGLGGQPEVRGDDVGVEVVRERVVAAQPVEAPRVAEEQHRLGEEDHRRPRVGTRARAHLSTHSRTSACRWAGDGSRSQRRRSGRGRRDVALRHLGRRVRRRRRSTSARSWRR